MPELGRATATLPGRGLGEGALAANLERLLQAAVLALMALAILAVMLGPLHRLPLWMPRDENEGWNGYQALVALSGARLYPPADALITSNYPPLSFYIVGVLGRILGDNIIAGRLIALLAELAVAANIYLLARALRAERFFALFSSFLFLLYIGANAQAYVAMDDPEWLGRAFVTGGAVLFLRAQRASRPVLPLGLSSLLCVAGVLVKHNMAVLPMVLFLWALMCDRRRLLSWTLTTAALGGVALLLLTHAYGPAFLQDVLGHKRGLSLHKLVSHGERLLSPMTALLVYAVLLGILDRREAATRFVVIYALVGGGIGLFFLSGIDIDVNALFDLIIALSLGAGLLAARLVSIVDAGYRRFAAVTITAAMGALCLPSSIDATLAGHDLIRQDRTQLRQYRDFIAAIAAARGPVVCEQPSLCYWAGKPFEIDVSNYGKKLRTGAVGPELLAHRFGTGYYTLIQTNGHPMAQGYNVTRHYLGEELCRTLDQRYATVRQLDEHYLLAPR